jgi:GxxExxY protein
MEPTTEANDLSRRVIGAAIEVHKGLGPGYQESFYEEAMGFELSRVGIDFERQSVFSVTYKEHVVGEGRVDFLIASILVLEIKAVERLQPVHKAQVISYLKATSYQVGLLINFNESLLRSGIQRIVYTNPLRLGAFAAN